ncbi:MAG: hypothetical protein FJ291_12000 [Planctomycetes bacterium]|nr:hypothetical protein [Planctomycetota bacterium]
MVSSEVLAELHRLSMADKLQVIQILVADVAREEGVPALPAGEYAVWAPHDAFEAAETLLGELDRDAKSANE